MKHFILSLFATTLICANSSFALTQAGADEMVSHLHSIIYSWCGYVVKNEDESLREIWNTQIPPLSSAAPGFDTYGAPSLVKLIKEDELFKNCAAANTITVDLISGNMIKTVNDLIVNNISCAK